MCVCVCVWLHWSASVSVTPQKVLKYTHDPSHRAVLSSTIKAFVVSLSECSDIPYTTPHPGWCTRYITHTLTSLTACTSYRGAGVSHCPAQVFIGAVGVAGDVVLATITTDMPWILHTTGNLALFTDMCACVYVCGSYLYIDVDKSSTLTTLWACASAGQ